MDSGNKRNISDFAWLTGLPEFFPQIVCAACDAWRRLFLPFQCLPYKLFPGALLPAEEAMTTFDDLSAIYDDCPRCRDGKCSGAPCLILVAFHF